MPLASPSFLPKKICPAKSKTLIAGSSLPKKVAKPFFGLVEGNTLIFDLVLCSCR